MKKNLLLVTMALLGYLTAFGQNPDWILGINKYNVPNQNLLNLPIPQYDYGNIALPNSGDQNLSYQGQLPTNASNMITNPSGNIVFFIVDNHIYNKNGYSLGNLNTTSYAYETYELNQVKGASEILIVPNPVNCQQYYIVSTRIQVGIHEKLPWVFLLDMGIQNYQSQEYNAPQCVMGELVPLGSQMGTQQNIGLSIESLAQGGSGHIPTPWFVEPNDPSLGKKSNVFLGATKKTSNNEHFVFISNTYYIFRFKISAAGFTFDNAVIPFLAVGSPDFNSARVRSELEVIELANGNFRIACPYYKSQNIGANTAWEWLYTAELNPSGDLIPSTVHTFPFFQTPGSQTSFTDVALKGLEFSGDGNILYVTHSTNSIQPNQFEYFNFNNPTTSLVPIAINPTIDAKFSLLERDANNAIYFTGSTGLYKLQNANTPSTAVIQVSSIPGVFNFENNGTTGFFSDLYKLYLLPDQIDKMNYSSSFLDNLQCCIENTSFDKDTHTAASGTLFWNGGSNPLNNNSGNTVTIKRELRVPAGTNLTITGMNLFFAPGARLVIENATIPGQQGGKLTLNGTTLSAATLCGSTSMWLGVEVWGNSTLTQGSLGNSTQGRLQMINGSKIEHAQIGILVSKRQEYYTPGDNCQTFPLVSTTVYDDNRTGGIISLSNAKIENNTTGIFFKPYIAATGIANKSIINRTAFVWDDNYRTDNIKYLVYLMRVKGIQMQADSFSNNISFAAIPSLFNKGVGIFSDNAQFSVLSMCNSSASMPIGVNCANYTRSTFRNLYFGINTANFNNLTYEVNRSNFTNCQSGITSSYTKNEKITENNFYTREIATSAIAPQPYGTGILLNSSRGYKIEENFFTENNAPNAPDETYGVYSISSGITHNEVYNNHFYRLKVGGRSDLINGLSVPPTGPVNFPTTGLQWICNNFRYPIMKEDILVHKGPIDYRQGYAITTGTANAAANYAARNTFSLYNENQTILNDHDISVIDNNRIKYVYLNSNSQTPDNVSPIVSTTLQTVFPNIVVSPNSTMCPSKLVVVPTKVSIATLLDNKQQLEETVDGGNTQNLKNGILNSSNPYTIVSPYSPYLSDEVISTFLASSASNEQKNIILSANAPLSAAVKEHVISSSLPQTIKDEVIAITGISPMVKLAEEISQAKSAFEEAFNNKLSQLYLDTLTTNQEIVDFLSSFATIEAKKELVYFYITIEDSVNAFELMDELYPTHPDFVNFHTTLNRINNFENLEQALSMDGSVVSSLENLVSNSNDSEIQTIAEYMLSIRGNYKLLPPMYDDESSKMQTQFQEADDKQKVSLLNLYPNPTAGILNFSSSMELTNLQFSIMDMNGRTVYSGEFKDVLTGQVNVAHLNKGLYLVQYKVNDSVTETKKIEIK